MMSTRYNYAGIDIAKRNFVIAVSSLSKTKTKTETNNPKGIAHTVEYLKKHNVALVVMESTGGLLAKRAEQAIADYFHPTLHHNQQIWLPMLP